MPIQITLKIGNETFDALRCCYGFSRKVDAKGRPQGGMKGGEIIVTLESSQHNLLFEEMIRKGDPKSLPGSLVFYEVGEGISIRTLEWEEAYIYALEETLHADRTLPMTQTIAITPLRLDVNKTVRMDRRFPQTYAFWWEEYKPEVRAVRATEHNTDDTYTITDAYWLDGENNKIRDLNVEKPVTLYVVFGQYKVGNTINLYFEDKEGEEVKTFECSGTVNSDGIIVVNNFKAAFKKEEK